METKTMKFKCELQIGEMVFYHWVYANNLQELSEELLDAFPKAKILSVIGGAA